MAEVEQNPIAVLQEYCQKNKLSIPIYTLVGRKGPAHDTIFTMRVNLDTHHVEGKANTKKSAKYDAAERMIDFMRKIDHTIDYKKSPVHTSKTPNCRIEDRITNDMSVINHSEPERKISSPVDLLINPIGNLQELCMKYKMILPVYEDCDCDVKDKFTVRCIMNNMIEEASASSKKKAKQMSAKQMKQRLINLNLIHDDRLSKCNLQVLNDPMEFHILKLDNFSLAEKKSASQVTEKAKNQFPDLKKNVKITVKDRKDLSIANFHSVFLNSFDATRRQKFHVYYKSLIFDEFKCTPEHLECILENICKILNIETTKSNMKTKCANRYVVCYTFNTIPMFQEIGAGKSYRDAHMSALIRTIEAIHLLLL